MSPVRPEMQGASVVLTAATCAAHQAISVKAVCVSRRYHSRNAGQVPSKDVLQGSMKEFSETVRDDKGEVHLDGQREASGQDGQRASRVEAVPAKPQDHDTKQEEGVVVCGILDSLHKWHQR